MVVSRSKRVDWKFEVGPEIMIRKLVLSAPSGPKRRKPPNAKTQSFDWMRDELMLNLTSQGHGAGTGYLLIPCATVRSEHLEIFCMGCDVHLSSSKGKN